jgi:predicted RND superfamily exporter protein
MAAWRGSDLLDGARAAADHTGTAIWTNALMVSAGFAVLATGHAKPLRNVGSLVSVALLLAAVATFVVIPLLARRARYGR